MGATPTCSTATTSATASTSDLGFTDADRVENIRRVAEVAKLMVDAGLIVLVSFISPFRAERRMARELFGEGEFVEVFVDTPLAGAERAT
jgi:bifunctional enzyme CysN/CysC